MGEDLLRRGMFSTKVLQAQRALNFHLAGKLAPLRTDCVFGPLTEARVHEFQRRNQLSRDGVIGPITRAKLLAIAVARLRIKLRRAAGSPEQARARPLQTRAGEPSKASQQLLVDWGQTFSFHPRLTESDSEEYLFQTELKLALKNNGEDDSIIGRISLDVASGQPATADWEFAAELETPVLDLSLIGPLQANLFMTQGFQLNPLTVGTGAGLKIGVQAIGGRIGIFAQGDLKLEYDPGTGEGKTTPSGSGVVEVKF